MQLEDYKTIHYRQEDGSWLGEVRNLLDNRYDDVKSARVEPVDGETFFDDLRRREDNLLKFGARG